MSTLEERRKLRAWRAGATKKAAQQALAAAHPGASGLNVKFRCATPQENLVGVGADVWRVVQRQLGGGSGGELRPDARGGGRPKFCSAWSSAALAVSSIAPFLQVADDGLTVGDIPGLSGGGTLEFECRRSAGVVGRRWPNLDFVVQATAGATFLESKTTEYLSLTHGELAAIYAKRAKGSSRRQLPARSELLRTTVAATTSSTPPSWSSICWLRRPSRSRTARR